MQKLEIKKEYLEQNMLFLGDRSVLFEEIKKEFANAPEILLFEIEKLNWRRRDSKLTASVQVV